MNQTTPLYSNLLIAQATRNGSPPTILLGFATHYVAIYMNKRYLLLWGGAHYHVG